MNLSKLDIFPAGNLTNRTHTRGAWTPLKPLLEPVSARQIGEQNFRKLQFRRHQTAQSSHIHRRMKSDTSDTYAGEENLRKPEIQSARLLRNVEVSRAIEEAIRAGYSKKTAEVQGRQILKKTLVARAIERPEPKSGTGLFSKVDESRHSFQYGLFPLSCVTI